MPRLRYSSISQNLSLPTRHRPVRGAFGSAEGLIVSTGTNGAVPASGQTHVYVPLIELSNDGYVTWGENMIFFTVAGDYQIYANMCATNSSSDSQNAYMSFIADGVNLGSTSTLTLDPGASNYMTQAIDLPNVQIGTVLQILFSRQSKSVEVREVADVPCHGRPIAIQVALTSPPKYGCVAKGQCEITSEGRYDGDSCGGSMCLGSYACDPSGTGACIEYDTGPFYGPNDCNCLKCQTLQTSIEATRCLTITDPSKMGDFYEDYECGGQCAGLYATYASGTHTPDITCEISEGITECNIFDIMNNKCESKKCKEEVECTNALHCFNMDTSRPRCSMLNNKCQPTLYYLLNVVGVYTNYHESNPLVIFESIGADDYFSLSSDNITAHVPGTYHFQVELHITNVGVDSTFAVEFVQNNETVHSGGATWIEPYSNGIATANTDLTFIESGDTFQIRLSASNSTSFRVIDGSFLQCPLNV